MDKSVQVCVKCGTSLAIGLKLHFCPYCGTAQLEKKLLDDKSTSHYDPSDPKFKPWRDRPKLPKRTYKPIDTTNKRAWCPAMRQPTLRPKRIVPLVNYDLPYNQTEQDTQSIQRVDEEPLSTEDTNETDVPEAEPVPVETPPEVFLGLYTENTNPLAIYDAEQWLAVGGMAVNISLVEQSLGEIHNAYWLRIGVMFDEDAPTDGTSQLGKANIVVETQAPELLPSPRESDESSRLLTHTSSSSLRTANTEFDDANKANLQRAAITEVVDEEEAAVEEGQQQQQQQQLYTIAVLSSNLGRLMVPCVDDWVDLDAVDPTEYYMVRHLERVLQSIAHRVVTTNLNELALRHTYSVHVRRRTKHTKLAEALVTVAGGLAATTVERLSQLHTTTAAWGYNSRQIVCQQLFDEGAGEMAGADRILSRTLTSISVCFQDWVVQLAHRLVLTRGISVRFYPSLVRVSFRYVNRLQDPSLFPGASSPTEVEEDSLKVESSGKYLDPRTAERNQKLQYFAAAQRITHVVLNITPSAVTTDTVVGPAEIRFDVPSIRHLLRDAAPADFDEMVAEGKKKVLFQFATQLARCVRLESTNAGVKYTVIGAFSEPAHETRGWPLDVPSGMDDDDDDEDGDLEDVLEELTSKIETVPVEEVTVLEEEDEEVGASPAVAEEDVLSQPPPPPPPMLPTPEEEPEVEPVPAPPSPSSLPIETPFREPCPIHSALLLLCSESSAPDVCGCCNAHCKCLHEKVVLKGSEVLLWADFSQCDVLKSALGVGDNNTDHAVDGDDEITNNRCLQLPSTLDAAQFLACTHTYTLLLANSLRLVAVDAIDPDLSCNINLPPLKVSELLRKACEASAAASDAQETMQEQQQQEQQQQQETTTPMVGRMRQYEVSFNNEVLIDLMQHPALRRACFDFICDSGVLDLFLSRKSRLMKLIVK